MDSSEKSRAPGKPVAIFAPSPLLSVTIEARGDAGDDIHLHPAGQGVWLARMAAELGALPILCSLVGGESGAILEHLLDGLPCELAKVSSSGGNGCYVMDRRTGERRLVSQSLSPAPSRHELDDLVARTASAALRSAVLAVCNPFPGDILPLDVYGTLVADVRENGTPVVLDLSSPRLDSALEGRPDLVKLNDWELAGFVGAPVSQPEQRDEAMALLLDRGASAVLLTRGGESSYYRTREGAWELVAPRFERGSREGCGDSMMGGITAGLASGLGQLEALRLGAAAGAANFLRHGLGTGRRELVQELLARVELRPL